MRAHEMSFLNLVRGEKQFQVPLYQRTHSWTEKQLAQLWRDLLARGDAMSAGAVDSPHFIGSVVIAPSPTLQAAGVNRWLLVDGQQRLTTCWRWLRSAITSAAAAAAGLAVVPGQRRFHDSAWCAGSISPRP